MRLKTTLAALLTFICLANTLFAQSTAAWTLIANSSISAETFQKNYKPAVFKAFHLDEQALRNDVAGAPIEGTIAVSASQNIITVPNAQGIMERFRLVESPVMEQGLADKFLSIKTYLAVGIDHPGSSMRFDLSPLGFNAMILSPDRKTTYINAVDHSNSYYVVFDRDGMAMVTDFFNCQTEGARSSISADPIVGSADDGQRRTFRLAVTVNGEFSQACLDGTETTDVQRKAKVLAVLTTDLNRANGIYDRDFGIRMNYVSNMDLVLYLDPLTDPFPTSQTNWNTTTQSTLTNNIGSANYDIGHFIAKVTSGNENGNAGCIGCVCKSNKGSGYTAYLTIQGDPLVVDYWTHEMGHQFGANHTFTFNTEGTGANMEPGSGSTIMGYAGITGSTDVQPHSDDYFHAKSVDQVTTYIKSAAGGGLCAVSTATGNATPTANAGADYIIPKGTPFMLTGQGSDVNSGDALTYTWEQYDNYAAGSNTFPGATNTTGPAFRSRTYSTSNQRVFPEINSILSGANSNTWEVLPTVARTMNFRLTVRDNSVLGGANNYDDMVVTVDGTTGPFAVTAPNSFVTWRVGEYQTITWSVAGTTAGTVNCANVAIELSTDGGNTFPVTLVASTPNDGAQEIIVPNNITSQARIRVKAVGNIFFDISNANFTIQAPSSGDFSFSTPDVVKACSGGSLSTTLNTASLAGYATPINLSATGNPAGSTVVFSNPTINPGSSVNVSLQGSVAAGTYNIVVTGISGSLTRTRTITYTVVSATTGPTLSAPANSATGIALSPSFSWSAIAGTDSYTLSYSTNATLSSGVTNVTSLSSTSYTISSPLNQNTQYYWKVSSINVCGSVASSINNFTTSAVSCSTPASSDVPKVISASGAPNVTSTINIASGGVINDVDVIGLVGTHTWISDLTVSIISPSITTVKLFDQICNNEHDFNLSLDDGAAITTFPCPPVGGLTIKPVQLLSAFNGQNSTGTWTLKVKDNYDQDGGSLNAWGLKICINGSSLPVSWLNFTARRNGESAVLVEWSTASEVNNKQFDIERSRDGINFEAIGTISAGNNPSGIQQYFFNDMKPFAGVNYYRLKQVDKDGKFKYSSIAKVTIAQDKNVYTVTPNPATTKAVVNVYTEMKKTTIRLIDVSGKAVYTVSKPVINAGETLDIPVSGLAKGYYLVMIECEAGRFTEKLVVQ